MRIKTNAPSALDGVLRILSANNIDCLKKSNNEADVISNNEGHIRSVLQDGLDRSDFDYVNDTVLVDGNVVWSYDRITKEIMRIKKKRSTAGISKYFYSFMYTNFTDVYFNINGWTNVYPSWESIKNILAEAEVPAWKTDIIKIINYVNEL